MTCASWLICCRFAADNEYSPTVLFECHLFAACTGHVLAPTMPSADGEPSPSCPVKILAEAPAPLAGHLVRQFVEQQRDSKLTAATGYVQAGGGGVRLALQLARWSPDVHGGVDVCSQLGVCVALRKPVAFRRRSTCVRVTTCDLADVCAFVCVCVLMCPTAGEVVVDLFTTAKSVSEFSSMKAGTLTRGGGVLN